MLKIYNKSNVSDLYKKLKNRMDAEFDKALKIAGEIIDDVKNNGDKAVKFYSKKFDWVEELETETNKAYNECGKELIKIMERAAQNIEEYHRKQVQNSYIITKDGIITGQRILPIERVALYVPGGSAAYPSTVLMNAIPAKIAGVKEIVILTPPKKEGINPAVFAAAEICGIDKIIKAGGAQAIAAAAYGTESIQKVDKIVGPGNIYVTAAKKLVYGIVDIDMIAGPSEILIIADKSANPKYIAADLMSQAEHDVLASSILVTDNEELIKQVNAEIEKQIKKLSRRGIIEKSLTEYGGCILCGNINEAIDIANDIAPEHLEISVENCFEKLD
jgi:histidinol dehydrogenase